MFDPDSFPAEGTNSQMSAKSGSSGRYGCTSTLQTPDGSWISFRQVGAGPPVILLHGLMGASHSHWDLAHILARRFTVILPDRRGRGASGPAGTGDPLECEVEDLSLLMEHCKARACIGISLGAIITLEAARVRNWAEPVVIFDPPFSIGGCPSLHWLKRYRSELAAGDCEAALVTAMLGTEMGPPGLRFVPRFLLKLMTRQFARRESASAPAGASMLNLVPTLERDVEIVLATADQLVQMNVSCPVLLIGTEISPAYFPRAFSVLAQTIPNVRPVILKGVGHDASNNRELGGSPSDLQSTFCPSSAGA